MSDDYLFDGVGSDPEVERLEELLAPYRRRATPPRRAPVVAVVAASLAMAAVALLAVGLWRVAQVTPWESQTSSCYGCIWEEGTALDTTGPAHTQVADRGELRATPGTDVRRLPGEGARLALGRGQIEVMVNAPPRWLVVELPGVDLVDLGCAYVARVDEGGHGLVQVGSGWVALEGTGPVTTLPAGTLAATWPSGHTGLPVAEGASAQLVSAVDAFDRGGPLQPVLGAAVRGEDALTVWHLLERSPPERRGEVLLALEELVPGALPARDRLLGLEAEALQESLVYVVAATL